MLEDSQRTLRRRRRVWGKKESRQTGSFQWFIAKVKAYIGSQTDSQQQVQSLDRHQNKFQLLACKKQNNTTTVMIWPENTVSRAVYEISGWCGTEVQVGRWVGQLRWRGIRWLQGRREESNKAVFIQHFSVNQPLWALYNTCHIHAYTQCGAQCFV